MICKYTVELNEKRHPILVEEERFEYKETNIGSPQQISIMMNELFHLPFKAEEYVYMISFSTAFEPLGIFEISHGNVNFSMLTPREIMIRALLSGASAVVIIHNHPSGKVTPSNDDMKTFEGLKQAFQLMNIEFQDYIIVGDGMYSFKKEKIF